MWTILEDIDLVNKVLFSLSQSKSLFHNLDLSHKSRPSTNPDKEQGHPFIEGRISCPFDLV